MKSHFLFFTKYLQVRQGTDREEKCDDPHKNSSKLHGFVDNKIKGKTRNFEEYLCGSLYVTFKTAF